MTEERNPKSSFLIPGNFLHTCTCTCVQELTTYKCLGKVHAMQYEEKKPSSKQSEAMDHFWRNSLATERSIKVFILLFCFHVFHACFHVR